MCKCGMRERSAHGPLPALHFAPHPSCLWRSTDVELCVFALRFVRIGAAHRASGFLPPPAVAGLLDGSSILPCQLQLRRPQPLPLPCMPSPLPAQPTAKSLGSTSSCARRLVCPRVCRSRCRAWPPGFPKCRQPLKQRSPATSRYPVPAPYQWAHSEEGGGGVRGWGKVSSETEGGRGL